MGSSRRLPARTAPVVRFERQRTEQGCCSGHRRGSRDQACFTPGPETVRTFKGRIILFGTRRENRPDTLGIEAMTPDGTALETILLLGKDQSLMQVENLRTAPGWRLT